MNEQVLGKLQIYGADKTVSSSNAKEYLTDAQGDITLIKGPIVPTSGTGYASGCIFIQSDGSKGTTLYINEGTNAACDFNAILSEDVYSNQFTAKVSLTNANIKALRATPITLVAAPGANKIIVFDHALLKLNYGTDVLTESADNLAIKYVDGSGAAVSETIECTGWIDQSVDTYTNAIAKKDAIVAASANVNKALVIHNTGDGEIGGNATADSTVDIYVTYHILNVA